MTVWTGLHRPRQHQRRAQGPSGQRDGVQEDARLLWRHIYVPTMVRLGALHPLLVPELQKGLQQDRSPGAGGAQPQGIQGIQGKQRG